MNTQYRCGWIFTYTTQELIAAAQKKVDLHTEKLAFWTHERDVREERLRAEGIDLRPAIRQGASNATSYYGQPVLDTDLLKGLQEAQERVEFHTQHLADFTRWMRLFTHEAERVASFSLTFEDAGIFDL